MRVLSLDSATEAATCAIIENDNLLGEIVLNNHKQHSILLMPMIDELLSSLKLTLQDIDGFVVSKGPGSFTGLRIGMATIKGFSQGTKKPFVSISTLDGLAYNMCYTDGIICPILDALRGNVYTAVYEYENEKLNRISDYMVVSIDELSELVKKYNRPVCFIGDAVPKYKSSLSNIAKVRFAPAHLNVIKAASLGELGLKLLVSGKQEDLYETSLLYLRKPQAEREYEKKMEKMNHE